MVVFRPGHLLGPHSALSRALRRLASLSPLFPRRLATCVLESSELFAAIESERLEGGRRPAEADVGRVLGRDRRAFTLLGADAWPELLRRHRGDSPVEALASAASTVLSWLLVGQLIAPVS